MPNGASDIKLLPGQVKVEAWDLCVDSKDRRKNTTPERRALVHDFDDGLTINYSYDYPGGVKINHLNVINARPNNKLTSPGATHLTITGNTQITGNTKITGDGELVGNLTVGGKVLFHKKVPAAAQPAASGRAMPIQPGQPPSTPLDLADVIATMQQQISELEKKLAYAQDNWRWCSKCQGLFFAGSPTKGVCPAGGQHSLEGSGNYRLMK